MSGIPPVPHVCTYLCTRSILPNPPLPPRSRTAIPLPLHPHTRLRTRTRTRSRSRSFSLLPSLGFHIPASQKFPSVLEGGFKSPVLRGGERADAILAVLLVELGQGAVGDGGEGWK